MVRQKKNSGFTLAELLSVVAIVGILVAISIPVFTTKLHKSKVTADIANLRSYFSEIQQDFLLTGEYDSSVADDSTFYVQKDSITFKDGTTVKLQAGFYYIIRPGKNDPKYGSTGYQILYMCNGPDHCSHLFGAD